MPPLLVLPLGRPVATDRRSGGWLQWSG